MVQLSVFATPQEAESAFYDAFERADIEAMMAVWANDESVVCIHPGGPRLQGPQAIKKSWQKIFGKDTRLKFNLTDNHRTQDSLIAVHLVKENIEVANILQGVMLVTNIYHLIDGSWRLMLHHASPEPRRQKTADNIHVLH